MPATSDHGRVLTILTVATFVVILNETLLVNAIPQLMHAFDVTAADAQWLSTAFMLTMAVVIPTTGWFMQRFQRRTVFALAMGSFTLGTLLAAVAPVFAVLLVGRIVQAAGTAMMMPLLMTTVMTLVPVQERGRTMGNVSLAISAAPALGPTSSGLILQLASWRWLFLLVLPLAVVMSVVGYRMMPANEANPTDTLDLLSLPLAALGFGGLIYGMTRVGVPAVEGAGPVLPPALVIALAVAALVALVLRQFALIRSERAPLLDLRALGERGFAVTMAIMCVAMMAMLGTLILVPIWLQEARGLTVLQAGLVMLPGALLMAFLARPVGRWYDRIGPRPLVLPGAVLATSSLAIGFLGTHDAPWWLFLVVHPLLSLGLALMFTPLFTSGLASLPPHLYSHGSAIMGTFQQVAAAAGTALAVTVMTARTAGLVQAGEDPVHALSGGVSAALGIGAAIFVLATALTLLVRRPAGAPTAA